MFREADTDNSKSVSRDELVAAVKKHMNLATGNDRPTVDEVADFIMEHFDHNEDGKVSMKEFVATLKALAKEHNYKPTKEEWKEAKAAFKETDTNNDGHVDRKELVAALKKHWD